MEDKIYYFAYGTNSTREMITAITGKYYLSGYPAIIKGFELFIQRSDQIPNTIIPTLNKSPREKIEGHWPNGNFLSYGIKVGIGDVRGTIWEMTKEERELVKNWEFVGFWYQEIKVKAITTDNRVIEVVTEILPGNQKTDQKVNGLHYNPFLMRKSEICKIATEVRQLFLKRK